MNLELATSMMKHVSLEIVASEPTLTKLDQAIGDGDHGIGMERGFKAVAAQLSDEFQATDIGHLMVQIGTTLMSTMGGASGAIFGTLFRAGGKAIKGEPELTTPVLATFLEAGLAGVYKRGGAQPGAKTMIDALVAAVEKSKTLDAQFEQAIDKVAAAAHEGVEATKDMIATTGKAKTLGERSLGHPDPGAVSMALILQFMCDFNDTLVAA